ncbi:MAG: glycerophosphodiester phosphodiesterase [Actinomycetia bacterium]|nr:glycerophosphodiester phosphodiesterase [Actinomycetes bacterium]
MLRPLAASAGAGRGLDVRALLMMTVQLRSQSGRLLRIGHKGAAALAPENTIESLAAALDHRVDMVELDVVRADDGELLVAHSPAAITPKTPTLDAALAFLAAEAPRQVGLNCDLKWYGYEPEALEALRRHGLVDRTLVCSVFAASLRCVRQLEPAATTGLSYPWDRHGVSERPWTAPLAHTGVAILKRVLPLRVVGLIHRADANVAVLHHLVITRPVVERCHRAGVPVLAWTVDAPADLERMVVAGVDGMITNNPTVFDGIVR